MLRRIVHADGVITGDGDALHDGAVVLAENGLVDDVGSAAEILPRHTGLPIERVRGVVFPGLVNAHTHLELSALRGQVPGGTGFVNWVEHLIGARFEMAPEHDTGAIERAVQELVSAGTVAVGEVTNSLKAVARLANHGLVGAVFHEVFGVSREFAMARVAELRRERQSILEAWPSSGFTYAPAPHTLYTTHREAILAVLADARSLGARTSLHLAEHAAERRALTFGDGPVPLWLARRLQLAESDFEWPKMGPFEYARELGALASDVLLVHLTDAQPQELDDLARSQAKVVLCPRSNLYIEVKLPPLLSIHAAGIAPALGTDSLASNASLDILAEARALQQRFPNIAAREFLQMATWNGAQVLGRPELGRIARGSRPGILAVEGEVGEEDPCVFLLQSLRAPRRWIARTTTEKAS